ncbi:hypothetical protein HYQ45_007618 [Verticillium longisporum]|uniref:Uncharacterized protein n=1 Tax=Verticillium longisporum TaxID=100787 RepID=A0A8I3APZ3_VERLO|nr:hypothetical protein HYQ45_007618 [Verticillium longisporum]
MALTPPVTILSLVHNRIRPEKLFKEDTDDPPIHRAPQSSTSWSAKLMKPVVVALERPVEDYLRMYANFHNVTQQRATSSELANNVQQIWTRLNTEHHLLTDHSASIISEHDVVRESAKHILHPVYQVMVLFGAVKSADRHDGVHFEVRTIGESEVTSMDEVMVDGAPAMLEGRPDMLLVRCATGQQPIKSGGRRGAAEEINSRSFCAFEYKNAHVLDRLSWKKAIKPVSGRPLVIAGAEWARRARGSAKRTFLDGRCVAVFKQAILYAILERTKHVVLYDSKSIVLLKFPLALQALLGFFFEAMEDTPRDSKQDGTLGV